MKTTDDIGRGKVGAILRIDRSADRPIHEQISAALRKRIAEGILRPGQRIPSIRELADCLDVNHLTIRQALRSLAEEGLVMSNQGRGTFVADKSNTKLHIALMVPNLSISLSSAISRGVESVASEHGSRVSIYDLHDDPRVLVKHLETLREHDVDGAIIFPLTGNIVSKSLIKLLFDEYPLVLIDRYMPEVPSWNVAADNFRGGYLATKHLIDCGCKSVAFISDLECNATRARFDGYREALGESDLVFRRDLVKEIVAPVDHTKDFVHELVSGDSRPDGIFFGNDIRAMWGLQQLKADGLNVPDDIQIVGFDDDPASAMIDPPLTTIRQDGFELGKKAAELFYRQVQQLAVDEEPSTTTIPVELVIRSSTKNLSNKGNQ